MAKQLAGLLAVPIIVFCFLFLPPPLFAEGPRSASVSATVLPTPENTKPKREKNFFEKMDPVQQLTVGSGVGLGGIVLGGGLFFVLQRRKK
ncbi:hypothetical protein HY732_04660 [Candidatus Uhrbacteria bacterium]|nr:hypothetical protein [Candidatus Uhrbacteria bacterium]